jgi:hypothetical protein
MSTFSYLDGKDEADSKEACSCTVRRNAMPTESHSDGQNVGYFPRTLRTVLLALGSSEPPLLIRTPRLLRWNSYLWRVHVVIYERPTTDHICRIRQVVEAPTPRWTFKAGMSEWRIRSTATSQAELKVQKPWCYLLEIMTASGASLIK